MSWHNGRSMSACKEMEEMGQVVVITPELRRFAQKVRFEGGVLDAIDYGIEAKDVPDGELARKWSEIERLYRQMRPLISSIEELVEAA